jgi:hypothetical protein
MHAVQLSELRRRLFGRRKPHMSDTTDEEYIPVEVVRYTVTEEGVTVTSRETNAVAHITKAQLPVRLPPNYLPNGPKCPECGRRTWRVWGPDPTPEIGSHYICPDGERWNLVGEHRQIVPFEPAE